MRFTFIFGCFKNENNHIFVKLFTLDITSNKSGIMVKSKAIEILGKLTKKELSVFGKYIDSQLFHANKKLPKLFAFLKKYYPDFNSEKFTKENLYKAVYGTAEFDDIKTRKLLSDLYKEAERFMVITGSLSQKEIYESVLLKQFDRRKLDNLFVSKYDEYNKYLDKGKKNSDYFLEKFLTEWRNILFYMERGQQHKISANIYRRTEYLVFYFLCDLSLSLNDIDAHRISFNYEGSNNVAEEFMKLLDHSKLFEYINSHDFENKELIYIYYLGYLTSKNFDDEAFYYRHKDYALKNFDKFNQYMQRASLLPLINYCVRKASQNKGTKFDYELYDYYNIYIKYKLYNISGKNYVRNDVLLNIFNNYFTVGRTSEIKKFVEDNIEHILPGHRKNMLSLASALSNFECGKFSESLRDISMIKSNTQLYRDIIKILSLKNHFELKNYDIAKELTNSYKDYLAVKKDLTETRRENRLKFLYYYNILWKFYDNKRTKESLAGVKREILSGSSFTESQWVLSKIDEFIKSKK